MIPELFGGSVQRPLRSTIELVATAVHDLIVPTAALFCACNQERLERRKDELNELERQLQAVAAKGSEAIATLQALTETPTQDTRTYTDIVKGGNGGHRK